VFTNDQLKECKDIARQLPLTYEDRPHWDVAALKEVGFKEITVNDNINDQERLYYALGINYFYPCFSAGCPVPGSFFPPLCGLFGRPWLDR
jgi:hypothetical protein